ncbi:response regulator transcription factor [Corynebacterium aquilae]|uniref:Sensory transduction protein RegX3 n=1 Tax=Corynebacterium aquilae DSM 44791 TaxID=1431546 RepID=A0A1L7CDN1_9CORY|nr:response regulator transcription factor [Corynebacterium aquilae]APT83938.1 XRE family transcriptional regulator [Corynebacterium aquilae DSM 44791]
MTRILIVEDEESLAEPLAFLLGREGFDTVIAGDGPQALVEFSRHDIDIVLLDLMLPGMSGMDVCTHLRQIRNVPIIMVTARDSELDKIHGLDVGADDYVTKPYSSGELIARIRAVLRRADTAPEEATTLGGPRIIMDTNAYTVTVDGQPIQLARKEYELLEMFLRHTGAVLSRQKLIKEIWGADYVGDTKTLDVHIKRLRTKLEEDPSEPKHVLTVRGVGYRFDA